MDKLWKHLPVIKGQRQWDSDCNCRQICGHRRQKSSSQGLKATGNQEFVFNGSEIALWGNENVPEMDGGHRTAV